MPTGRQRPHGLRRGFVYCFVQPETFPPEHAIHTRAPSRVWTCCGRRRESTAARVSNLPHSSAALWESRGCHALCLYYDKHTLTTPHAGEGKPPSSHASHLCLAAAKQASHPGPHPQRHRANISDSPHKPPPEVQRLPIINTIAKVARMMSESDHVGE